MAHVRRDAVSRDIDAQAAVLAADGTLTRLSDLFSSTSPTVVAFVSRFCVHSRQRSPSIQALADRLRAEGVRVIAMTDEGPSDAASDEFAALGLTIPVFFDTDQDASLAFANSATPALFVVDEQGEIRYEHIDDFDSIPGRVGSIRDSR